MKQDQITVYRRRRQNLPFASHLDTLEVKCPDRFKKLVRGSRETSCSEQEPLRTNRLPRIVIVSLLFLVAAALMTCQKQESSKPLAKKMQQAKWITISYAELIDPEAIIRTGQSLKSALRDPDMRGAIQPFVDSYSFLLQHALEMVSGADRVPHSSVVQAYPPGSAQPAWASIFRGGRIRVTTDEEDHARVFLLGDDPQKSYEDNYSVIRHCLNALVPANSSTLNVEVYAYKNDYSNSELRLNLNPYLLCASAFPSKGFPLDLCGLAAFFDEGPEIQGAQLDRSKGLILYGKLGEKQTLAGTSISLSDLVVAYRAVFHAGDNDAFVSLDPHLDPTRVTVNFGGFLEDTRIGAVVLESDKRFKTITCGLDPNTCRDLRRYTRQHVPSFLSVAEQDLLDSNYLSQGKWIGTRFWFYPDSVEIESDLNYQYAVITNPVFMADAERSRDDFASLEEFQRKKNVTLSPSIRRNIDHLNQNYAQYAGAFSELQELTAVARLMGICSWLYKANARWLDLDALLSVELPAFATPRQKTQLVAASIASYSNLDSVTSDYVVTHCNVVYLSPILGKKVSDYFVNSTNLAKYLCVKNGMEEGIYSAYESEAAQLFDACGHLKVRDIIKTKEELRALASYSVNSLSVQESSVAKSVKSSIKSQKNSLEKLKAKIEEIEESINSAANDGTYNALEAIS
jgi:hypothetical protein